MAVIPGVVLSFRLTSSGSLRNSPYTNSCHWENMNWSPQVEKKNNQKLAAANSQTGFVDSVDIKFIWHFVFSHLSLLHQDALTVVGLTCFQSILISQNEILQI